MSTTHPTLLAQLTAERRWTHEDAVREFARTAAAPPLGQHLTISASQWRRWLAGSTPLPRPANARVLECLFARPVEELFAPPPSAETRGGNATHDPCDTSSTLVEETVLGAARDCANFITRVEQSSVGPITLEQFHADVRRLALAYPNRPVFPSFIEIAELRDRAFDLLEGHQPPNQTRDLYLITGQLCAMLSMASLDLGWASAAETQARTAWLCADLAGDNALRVWVRGMQARTAYWDNRPADAVRLAEGGRQYLPKAGTALVQLAVVEARALGKLHDRPGVEAALGRAESARDAVNAPDDPGGLFSFPEARQVYYGATARVWLGHDYRLAAGDAERAISLYLADPPGQRRLGEMSLARLDLAAARLGLGDLEGACEQIREVLAVSSRRRTFAVNRRLHYLAAVLSSPTFSRTPLAAEARDEIEAFNAVSLVPALPTRGGR